MSKLTPPRFEIGDEATCKWIGKISTYLIQYTITDMCWYPSRGEWEYICERTNCDWKPVRLPESRLEIKK